MPQLSADSLPLILVFVVPGFVAMKIYSLLNPAKRLDWSAAVVEVVSYGSINLAVWWWLIVIQSKRPEGLLGSAWLGPISLLVLFASPAVIAVAASIIRRTRIVQRWASHPLPSAWDFFFQKRKSCWVLFSLKDGTQFGGYFGENSFASSYPESQELFVEDVWRVDDLGRFVGRVEGNLGMMVRYDDCKRMQLFKAEG